MTLSFYSGVSIDPSSSGIPTNVIFMWPGTNASIPTGWTRETTLDDRFTKGTAGGVNPDVTGGAATHTHTSPGHTHTIAAHTHAGTSGNGLVDALQGAGPAYVRENHTHTFTSGSISASADSTIANFNSQNNEPAFFRAIFIKSNGSPLGVPNTGVAFKNSSALPTDWIQHVGSKTRFMLGAAAAGDGGTTGGGGSHTHTASHTHSVAAHLHGTVISAATSTPTVGIFNAGGFHGIGSHSHSTSFSNDGGTTGTTAPTTAGTSYEPSFYTLLAIQNNKGSVDWPGNLIGMWLGTLANIPSGWKICDGTNGTPDLRNRFIKCADVVGDLGVTGGSDGHDHTDPASHTHTTSHTHTPTLADSGGASVETTTATAEQLARSDHTHGGTTDATDTGTGGTVQTVDSTADSQPAFRTVAYIEGPSLGISGTDTSAQWYEV